MAEEERERDLGDIVLSWSVQEIMNDDLYKGKVIDRSFGWRALGSIIILTAVANLNVFVFVLSPPFWLVSFRVICVRRSIHSVMVRCFLGFLVLICICSTIRMSCCCCWHGLWLCGRSWPLGA